MFSRCLLMESCVDDVSDTQGSVPEGIEFSLHEEAVSELSVPSVGVVLPQRSLEDMLKCAKSIITACVHLQDRIQPRFYQRCTALSCGMFTGRAQQHRGERNVRPTPATHFARIEGRRNSVSDRRTSI